MQTPWCCRQNSIPCCHNSIQALARVYSCLSSERQWDKVIVISSLPNLVHWLKCVAEFRLCQLNIPSQLNITLNNFAAFLSQFTGWSSSPRILVGILKTSNTVGPERAQNVPSLYPPPPLHFYSKFFLELPSFVTSRILHSWITQRWSCKDRGSEIFALEKPFFYKAFHFFTN